MSCFNEIKNQFEKIIKVFQSYNAKMYFLVELSSILSWQGISH